MWGACWWPVLQAGACQGRCSLLSWARLGLPSKTEKSIRNTSRARHRQRAGGNKTGNIFIKFNWSPVRNVITRAENVTWSYSTPNTDISNSTSQSRCQKFAIIIIIFNNQINFRRKDNCIWCRLPCYGQLQTGAVALKPRGRQLQHTADTPAVTSCWLPDDTKVRGETNYLNGSICSNIVYRRSPDRF